MEHFKGFLINHWPPFVFQGCSLSSFQFNSSSQLPGNQLTLCQRESLVYGLSNLSLVLHLQKQSDPL